MKLSKFILIGLLALMANSALADIEGAPFIPEIDRRFDAIEQGNHYKFNNFPQGSADGHYAQQEAQATWDFAKQGGGSTAPFDLGVALPANAIVIGASAWSITKPTGNVGAKLGFYCNTGADLMTDTVVGSFGSAGNAVAGAETYTATSWSTILVKCDIKARISGNSITAGKVTLYVNYVVQHP